MRLKHYILLNLKRSFSNVEYTRSKKAGKNNAKGPYQFGDESVTLVHQYEDKIDDLSSTDLHFTEGTGTWRDLNGQEYTIIALGPDKAESDKEVYILNSNYELEYRTYEDGTVEEFSENTGSNE